MPRLVVVGAGIAGLAAAAALQRRGLHVTVFEERTDTSSGAGTGDKAGDGRINLPLDEGEAGTEYRWVMVWFTTPPASGPTVRINEFKLYG